MCDVNQIQRVTGRRLATAPHGRLHQLGEVCSVTGADPNTARDAHAQVAGADLELRPIAYERRNGGRGVGVDLGGVGLAGRRVGDVREREQVDVLEALARAAGDEDCWFVNGWTASADENMRLTDEYDDDHIH